MKTPDEIYARYRPQSLSDTLWDTLRPGVIRAARAYYAPSPHGAKTAMYACTRYATWCHEHGIPTNDPETQYHPANVRRFIEHGCPHLTDTTRATLRCVLEAVGPNITRRAPWPTPPTPLKARKKVADPYTPEQLCQYTEAVSYQLTDRRTRVLMAILALSHGAGLPTREAIAVTAADFVLDTAKAPYVEVRGEQAREVPVLPRYAGWLRQLSQTRPTGPLIGESAALHDPLSHLRKGIYLPGHLPSLTTARLRSTWMLEHLNRWTPLNVLVAWAGMSTLSSITDLLPYVHADPSTTVPEAVEVPHPQVVCP